MKKNLEINYLEKIPLRNKDIHWTVDENGIMTLEIENRGVVNRIFQKLFKKPKKSFIHLDETGSFVWSLIDGERNVGKIGEELKKKFGEKAYPVYERLSKYFEILKSYGFAKFTDE